MIIKFTLTLLTPVTPVKCHKPKVNPSFLGIISMNVWFVSNLTLFFPDPNMWLWTAPTVILVQEVHQKSRRSPMLRH